MLSEAPSYIKQDVLGYLHGYHLANSSLFATTHKDFLRQLVTLMERRVYLPGNVIVEKGDIDYTMYFIHNGEVGGFDIQNMEEVQCFLLTNNMSFGEAQGFHGIPYDLTYKALTMVVVLALEKSSWEYLLEWFPASEEELKKKGNKSGLKGFSTYSRT